MCGRITTRRLGVAVLCEKIDKCLLGTPLHSRWDELGLPIHSQRRRERVPLGFLKSSVDFMRKAFAETSISCYNGLRAFPSRRSFDLKSRYLS